MNCPWCGMRVLVALSPVSLEELKKEEIIPLVCEECAGISLIVFGQIIKIEPDQLTELKKSVAWREYLEPALKVIQENIRRTKN